MNQRILHHDPASTHHDSAATSPAPTSGTLRLTTAQALVRYLAAQRVRSEDGSGTEPLFGGVFAIFGHGNVAGIGEALYQHRHELPTLRAHNEQAMAHSAIAYAKAHFRRRGRWRW
jgi:3D-(3,5/4)-trihydroxycyclohexane-1,2-dione acylhydrolase (decyclizing)